MCYPPRQGTFRCVTHPFAARRQGCPRAAARLACVKHSASVQSEPGSNSSVQSVFNTALKRISEVRLASNLTVFSCKCLVHLFSFGSSRLPVSLPSNRPDSSDPSRLNPSISGRPIHYLSLQAPTPIGCLIVKELRRTRRSASAERPNYTGSSWVCKGPCGFFY